MSYEQAQVMLDALLLIVKMLDKSNAQQEAVIAKLEEIRTEAAAANGHNGVWDWTT